MSIVRQRLFANAYRDSVELMRIAAEVERQPGVDRAGLVMATPANLAILSEAGLAEGLDPAAGPNDLVVAVAAVDEAAATGALDSAAALMRAGGSEAAAGEHKAEVTTIAEAVRELPDANLVLVSTPGPYAGAEAFKALKRGMHVFLFSDNVPIAEEVELKALGTRKGLLVMGPDCGTAILDGIPLGFANAVRRGTIGLIGASGTGLQQVSCLIDALGGGVSQAIGVGGRDLHREVGGAMMLAALERLSADPGTEAIVLISKPPDDEVATRVLAAAGRSPKPVVVNFLGGAPEAILAAGCHPAATFEDAAQVATALIGLSGQLPADSGLSDAAAAAADGLNPGQTAIAGLFSGGSLAGEAKLVLKLMDAGRGPHTIIDLGDDEYTVGRPHPMIDPRLRSERIAAAGADPTVGVILLDVVLGFASHHDPAGALLPAIEAARVRAEEGGRGLVVVASVCGAAGDPQGLAQQRAELAGAGVLVAASNARAARVAGEVAWRVSGAGVPR